LQGLQVVATVYPGYRSTPTTSNITLSSGGAGTSTVSVTGAGGSGGVLMAGSAGTNWTTAAKTTMQGQLQLDGANPDIMIGGKSMVTWMQKVEQRLSILEPKPELLAKYAALQQAYDHYKTLEALLHGTENDSQD
jgi:hypothetical protein